MGVRVYWNMEGLVYREDLVKEAAKAGIDWIDPTGPICVVARMRPKGDTWHRCTGLAYRSPWSQKKFKFPPSSRRLIVIRLPWPGATSWPATDQVYANKELSSRDWPRYDLHSIWDSICHTAAHEATHCLQYDRGGVCGEMEAERRSVAALRALRGTSELAR